MEKCKRELVPNGSPAHQKKGAIMDIDLMNEYFSYDNGCLLWKKQAGRMMPGYYAGCSTSSGYVKVKLFGKTYLAHRIIFALNHGYAPEIIDHINRDKRDNKIENLRAATRSENSMNMKPRSDGSAKTKNVRLRQGRTKENFYEVEIKKNGKAFYIGSFKTIEEASAAALNAQKIIHGKFAPI